MNRQQAHDTLSINPTMHPPTLPPQPPPTPPPLLASATTTQPKTFFRKTMQTWATEQTDNTELSASVTERPEVGSINTSTTSWIYCLRLALPSSLVPPVAGALVRTKAASISMSVSYSLISATAQKTTEPANLGFVCIRSRNQSNSSLQRKAAFGMQDAQLHTQPSKISL